MPRYRIVTTTMVRRSYEVEAADQTAAEELACNGDLNEHLVHEEDVSEDVDDVAKIETV